VINNPILAFSVSFLNIFHYLCTSKIKNMKKITFVIAAVGLISMTSCKKDYTCTCTDGTDTEKFEFKDAKKKDAKNACDTWNSLYAIGGGSCSL
jgi:hypothetical protein